MALERAARHVPTDPGRPVPARVLASWQRSEEYGVSTGAVEPVFSSTYSRASLFSECGNEVLEGLHRTLANEPVSLMLTDAEGLVLHRLSGDSGLLRALDDVHLAPGFSYAENEAGTNGLGLALADRVPTVVRAEEHYAESLCVYTCAAAPVLDPRTGRLEGAVNLTTWSSAHSELLLALAQSAAGNTSALMLSRWHGELARPALRGEVYRMESARLEPGAGTLSDLSADWQRVVGESRAAAAAGRMVLAVGEPGSGRATALAQALRGAWPRDRILAAKAPAPEDVEPWLDLWSPELGKEDTSVVVCDVDALPVWAAERLRDQVRGQVAGQAGVRLAFTAASYADVPRPLGQLVDTVVQVPPLRERSDDVLPLARHAAARVRGREVGFTRAAEHALTACGWPGGVAQLVAAVRDAATRTDLVDVRHLPAAVLSGSTRRLTRIETFERDEIVRVLTRPGTTMKEAAVELGMSRATLYRKIGQYDVTVPRG